LFSIFGGCCRLQFAARPATRRHDGAAVPTTTLFEFGNARVASCHYSLPLGPAPLALLLNRKKLDRLPVYVQDIIRKCSGEWAAARFIESRAAVENQVMAQLKSPRFAPPNSPRQQQRRATSVLLLIGGKTCSFQ
jgi:TRAP-type C4-dicarboxylate transport system substrate-binding protein